jgi:N4-(beta-N-acetylglucosaminyl)-L-asparaginase
MRLSLFLSLLLVVCVQGGQVVVNTWSASFSKATEAAYAVLDATSDPIEAVVAGARKCQDLQCDHSVGYGGSPDESGDTTLDAMVIDGNTMHTGSVGFLKGVKDAVGVAREVLRRTDLAFLAGSGATEFARQMGFSVLKNLETPYSQQLFQQWRQDKCQPNFWQPGTVIPDPTTSCGPYRPVTNASALAKHRHVDVGSAVHRENHDTIAIAAISKSGSIAAAVSTNGLNHKIVGRVGDSALPGAGAMADSEVGACGETGDGDIMLRFSSCALVVEWMRLGMSPQDATNKIIARIARFFPSFVGGIFAVNKDGVVGASAYGWVMNYTIRNETGLYVLHVGQQ